MTIKRESLKPEKNYIEPNSQGINKKRYLITNKNEFFVGPDY